MKEPRFQVKGETLLAMLRRVAAGEDPGLVYAEFYVNCIHVQEKQ